MPTLNLGVIVLPYDDGGKPAPRRKAKPAKRPRKAPAVVRKNTDPTDTEMVATILEAKYGIMEIFYDSHEDEIKADIIDGLEGALEDLYAGAPSTRDPFAEATSTITQRFKSWLSSGAIEQMGIDGVPTDAANKRRSLRFKSKKAPAERPSFIDTGTYERAFFAWVEQ